ncbi:NAD(P)-dependent oxidoreductase [Arthrobacter sp. MI7-26]|uniref:NAD(P)-dependent oxidoreductase n=1 Tax=Arthrobacter sp. MI7-26 TaxID=2993653 RepID=UPI0022496777|nr:NAD(P)-dependent oxidoreductase [Arthrobacter sp. MI7-26]MCX2750438.1 NAD(P)-dependent oxidoreductase [Arthrobacter sp. MI7-26]
MTTLGFIGLGNMGSDMAKRLLNGGHEVLVWNRSAHRAEELVEMGAQLVGSPAEALNATISFSMLANDAATEEVLTDRAIAGCSSRTHVVMASISPSLAQRLSKAFADAGASYVAAPVLGRPEVAAKGQLDILAAGANESIALVTPYLEMLGKRVWYMGTQPSVANAVKVAVNYNIIHSLQALGESIAMSERVGVSPEIFVELLSSTLFPGAIYSGYGSLIATQNYFPPKFRVELGRKDLALAEELAKITNLQLPTLPALVSVFDEALSRADIRDGDWSAIAEVTRRQ